MNNTQCYTFPCCFLFLILFTAGCAKQHSVQINDDSLEFYYRDAGAKEISFVSSMDHFHYHPAIKGGDNIWQVTVSLKKGIHLFL